MADTSNRALLIFIKNPQKGHVKTRLAATVGDDKALRIYQKLLVYTRDLALGISADRMLWYSQDILNDGWDEQHFTQKVQQGKSLGERMKHAFEQAFEAGCEKAVIIGSDCAQLEPEHLEYAYLALKYHEVVLGPSEDGGYYLLGMSEFLPELFDNKPWSTDEVLQKTLEQCRDKDWHYHLLEELNDVDTEADWQQVKDRFE